MSEEILLQTTRKTSIGNPRATKRKIMKITKKNIIMYFSIPGKKITQATTAEMLEKFHLYLSLFFSFSLGKV